MTVPRFCMDFVNLRLKPISATAASMELPSAIVTLGTIRPDDIAAV